MQMCLLRTTLVCTLRLCVFSLSVQSKYLLQMWHVSFSWCIFFLCAFNSSLEATYIRQQSHLCTSRPSDPSGVNCFLRHSHVTMVFYPIIQFTMNNNMFQQIGFPRIFHIAIIAHIFLIQKRSRFRNMEFYGFRVMLLTISIFALNFCIQFVH